MEFREGILLGEPSMGVPTRYLVSSLLIIGIYGLYRQLLPKPLPGIPYNALSASSL